MAARQETGYRSTRARWSKPSTTGLPTSSSISRTSIGPAQPVPATPEQHRDTNWRPDPQFWVPASECGWTAGVEWVLGFKEITAPTNVRTLIAALFPTIGFGNKVPILKPETTDRSEWLLAANLNATILDFVTRQKVQGQTLNLFIVEQLPVVPPDHYETICFGSKTAGEIVREAVLELTYTAHDMAPFAHDLGHLDEAGKVKLPFRWDEDRRLRLRAKLDAVFFHLYGVTNRDEVRYIYSTFPHRRTPGNRSVWPVPLLRPLPLLDQCAGGRPPGREDRVGSFCPTEEWKYLKTLGGENLERHRANEILR